MRSYVWIPINHHYSEDYSSWGSLKRQDKTAYIQRNNQAVK